MTEMSGWVKLHRKAFNNPVITKDAHYFYLWCYLLTHAAHAQHKSMFNGTIITLEPGQLITGRDKMARILRVHRSKIERIIKWFISEHQIEQQTGSKSRLITIKNWHMYQQSEHRNEQQMSNKRATNEQQMSTIQECKELKNEKKYLFADANLKKNLGKFLGQFYKKEVVVNIKVGKYLQDYPEKIIKLALTNSTCTNEFKFIECLDFYTKREKKRADEATG